VSFDVVVIGGGIVGAASAYHLASFGARVALLESRQLAYGASGRNLGYVWLHTRRAGPELDLVMWNRRQLAQLPEELNADFDLRLGGGLIYFTTDEQAALMREFVAARVRDGVDMRLVDGNDARELAPILPPSVIGATYCPLDAQIDPARYVQAFAKAAGSYGAEIREGVTVTDIVVRDGRVAGVETDAGPIAAGRVVLATGSWAPQLLDRLGVRLPVYPMRLQVLQTEPMPRRLDVLLYGPAAIKQYTIFSDLPSFRADEFETDAERRHGLVLLEAACQQPDGRYILGCAMDYPGFDWQPTLNGVALIAEGLTTALPELRAAKFARAWAGLLPFTPDNLPVIGPVPGIDGLIVAAGHVFGNGAGPTTGRLVAELACGAATSLDVEPYRVDRPALQVPVDQSRW
jgi:glycine/D-amino acid oxidase-like deaminating enzyme